MKRIFTIIICIITIISMTGCMIEKINNNADEIKNKEEEKVEKFKPLEEKDTIVVFLYKGVKTKEIEKVEKDIKKIEGIESVTFKSKEVIAEESKEKSETIKNALKDEEENPFLDEFIIKIKNPKEIEDIAKKIETIQNVKKVMK